MQTLNTKDNAMPKYCGGYKKEKGFSRAKIMLHNLLTILFYLIGAIIISFLSVVFAVIFLLYCVLATLGFMRFICAFCPQYGTTKCPSGYARITARLFKKKDSKDFKIRFKRNLGIVIPAWLIPIIAGVFLLLKDITFEIILLFVAFVVVGFIVLPITTR
ncbi:MAG: hypothetical protein JSV56_08955 [Methanomassiliicoccales archaeon]|nr:MAG: hypothetical protein JSV56_08955 [Methanomassiliicoccales archaeon]